MVDLAAGEQLSGAGRHPAVTAGRVEGSAGGRRKQRLTSELMPRYDEHGLALPPITTSKMNKNRKQKLESLRCVGRP